jgi:NADH-quinone oxidoreductase subunit H
MIDQIIQMTLNLDMPQMSVLEWIITLGKFAFVFIPLAFIVVMIFMERKGASLIQDRLGPNRSALPVFGGLRFFGFVHNFTDGIKLFTKETFIPTYAHKVWYVVAPGIGFLVAFLTPAVIPWFAPLTWWTGDHISQVSGMIIDSDTGILLMFALSSLSIYGTAMSAWASNSKYALLGGMRATAMMISYEVSMGLSLMGIFLLAGSFNLQHIVAWQEAHVWGIFVQPVAFFVFLTSMIAETGRAPFDVAESESEIVAGYHLEYSAMRFGLFYMGEYAHIVIASIIIATLFLGGYAIPFVSTDLLRAHVDIALALCLGGLGTMIGGFHLMVRRWKKVYATMGAKDAGTRNREYSFLQFTSGVASPVVLALAVAVFFLLNPMAATTVDGTPIFPAWVSIAAAAVQVVVLIAKAFLFCWIWIWVRWTLPRFRYDQVMSLGWKILLNLALVNLVVTAIIAKLVTGVR